MIRKTFANGRDASQRKGRGSLLTAIAATGLVVGAGLMQSCDKDILSGQPQWLGNSIYERLEEGIDGKSFSVTLRLIDDLNQKEVLAQTGSKTLFVASDEAYQEWFQNNSWGVKKYEDLTPAQKKLLFNNSMINNAYLVELMSNVSGNPPQEGLCMRRETASSIQDSVPTLSVDQFPAEDPMNNPELDAWAPLREAKKPIKIYKDNTTAPMIHFLPKFMEKKNITSEDLSVLTNGKSTSVEDSWINGRKVISSEQTCKNGYIYVVDGVIESNPNMAEIIRNEPEMSQWSKLLDRFSAPFYNKAASDEYNRLHNTNDSLYVLQYYNGNDRDKRTGTVTRTPDNKAVPATLAFNPGWNQYVWTSSTSPDLHYDAGAMIVPTNTALDTWWNTAGSGLQQEYGSWENVPALTLSKLINVNMLTSFVDYVPSKFGSIVDDAKVELGIEPGHVVKTFMGCNGVVYLVDRVFGPSEYRSVVYPALAHQSLHSIIYHAIDSYDFGPYLNSMDSRFSLILPSNQALANYLDPCSFGLPTMHIYSFYFDEKENKIMARRYEYTPGAEDPWGKTYMQASDDIVENRLKDLVDNLIIIGDIEDGKEYYKTKAGSMIRVTRENGEIKLQGGYDVENNEKLDISVRYDMTDGGNGISYGVDIFPMTASKSVYGIMKDNPECNTFFNLIADDETKNAFFTSSLGTPAKYYCVNHNDDQNKNVRLFDKYNYTVYVPQNDAVQKLIDDGLLPTWADYAKYSEDADRGDKAAIAAQEIIATRIENFVRYHFQDNSVYIGGPDVVNNKYESAKLNESTRRYYWIEVNNTNGMTVKDYKGNKRNVITTDGNYNLTAREYWFTETGTTTRNKIRSIYSSSDAVVHLIDGVLLYEDLTSWKDEVEAKIAEINGVRARK